MQANILKYQRNTNVTKKRERERGGREILWQKAQATPHKDHATKDVSQWRKKI